MKKIAFYICLMGLIIKALECEAQDPKYVYTVGGGGASFADNIPATSANLTNVRGISVDDHGNVYLGNGLKVLKLSSATGYITNVAGSGTATTGGDGGPATAAGLKTMGIHVHGNSLIIAGYISNRIRKVDLITGIITTIAGPSVVGSPVDVFEDETGDVYFSDQSYIRKIEAGTSTITAIAGNGTAGYTGDGGPATNAGVRADALGIAFDEAGNLYFSDKENHVIRKIEHGTGNIFTIAGTGIAGFSGDSGPATSAQLNKPNSLAIDIEGNIIIGDGGNKRIRVVDATTGEITTVAGGGTDITDGANALSANIGNCVFALDNVGNMFICETPDGKIKKITNFNPRIGGGIPIAADSFKVFVVKHCEGPNLIVSTNHYSAGQSVKTDFGDGTSDSSATTSGSGGSGKINITHSYPSSGTYIIKQFLFQSGVCIDSISFPLSYNFCRTLPVKYYYDHNVNCSKDAVESYSWSPVLTEVDSNGVAVDTISATRGFYYDAYCSPGDVYSFKLISFPGELGASCTSTAILKDTVMSGITIVPVKYGGLSCTTSTSAFDLSMNNVVTWTRPNRQMGYIYADNRMCLPTNATLKLHFSPKYVFANATPTPTSVSGNSITWDLYGLSSVNPGSSILRYELTAVSSSTPIAGDTVHQSGSINPIPGDSNPVNNSIIRIDTVRASHDPNEVTVIPSGCLPESNSIDTLQYTINFENMGNDTAHNIYVLDTLPKYLDPKSIRILNASAEMDISVFKVNTFNVVKFDFPNIMLPDSSHHNLCHGGVIFTIKTVSGLPAGTIIENRAGIYFDENEVVLTNTAQNIKGCPSPLHIPIIYEADISIYPNPANTELTIVTEKPVYSSYSICDVMGRRLLQHSLNSTKVSVYVGELPPGLYYLALRGEQGSVVRKFVKQ